MTRKRKPFRFEAGDHVVAVRAEHAAGPGWSNRPLWVYVRDREGKIRQECLQPADQSRDVLLLFSIAELVDSAIIAAVNWTLRKRPREGE